MAIIKASLFKVIRLHACTWSVNRVKNIDLAFLAPFIQKVVLFPSPYNMDLDFEGSKKMPGDEGEDEEPLTDTEMTAAFKSYRRRAKRDEALATSGELARVWAQLFRQLQNAGI
jgi:hypothetical protein